MMPRNTKQQGHLDGLCGVYAIVNASLELGAGRPDDIFKRCCSALPKRAWPTVLWDGTDLADLKKMLRACEEEFTNTGISVEYPFANGEPKSNSAFWREFDNLFARQGSKRCAILGFEEPWLHWIVARPDREGGKVLLIDSDGIPARTRVPRSDIWAGKRRPNEQRFRLNRQEVVLLSQP